MDQMETSLLQVQAFGERVGADQDDAVLFGTALRDPCALGFGIDAADCQHLAIDRMRTPQRLERRQLAVGVFRVDQDIGVRILAADYADLINQRGKFGIKRFRCHAKADQRIERLGGRTGVYQRGKFRGGENLQIGGHAIGLQFRDVAFRRLLQHAEPQQPLAICPQRP